MGSATSLECNITRKNPWTLERLNGYVDAEEGYQLEFKSSQGLLDKPDKFFIDLSADVSAFINSEGGILIIGIEEAPRRDEKQAGKAIGLSQGVPRSKCNKDKLSSAVCDRIHPSVASYVQVYPVIVGKQNDEDLLAFIIDISPGITAYQAADKKYYSRRSSGNDPMEDKDIRLRMLSDDKPRGKLSCEFSWQLADGSVDDFRRTVKSHNERGGNEEPFHGEGLEALDFKPSCRLTITARLVLFNIGTVTIREGAVAGRLEIFNLGSVSVSTKAKSLKRFRFFDLDDTVPLLYPETSRSIAEWEFNVPDHWKKTDGQVRLESVSVYLDNGPPVAVNSSFDLTKQFLETVEGANKELRQIASCADTSDVQP